MTVLDDDSTSEVLRRLLERTRNRRMTWSEWNDETTELRADTTRFMYYIKSRDDDDQAPFILEIWRKTEEGRRAALEVDEIQTEPGKGYNDRLEQLYRTAKASYLGIDTLRDDLLEDLDEE